ncbi:hypothetical protein Hdeb2414_s0013g00409471 [Helianthus debilis subsp. tardiflorus]
MPYRLLDAYGACTRRRSLWDMDCYVPCLTFELYEFITYVLGFTFNASAV